MKKLTDSSDESFDSSDDGITKKVTQSSKGQPKEKMKAKARKIDSDDSSDGIKTMPPKKKEAQGSSSGDQSDSSDHTPPKKNNRKGKELFSSSDEDEQIKGEEVAKSVGAKRINFGKLAADRLSGQVEKNSKNGSRKETKGSGKKETIDISDGSSDREEEKRDRVDNLKPGGSVTRAFGADKKKAQANKGYQSVNDLALAVATRKFAPDKRQMALRLTEGRHFDRLKVGELKPEKQNVITSNNFQKEYVGSRSITGGHPIHNAAGAIIYGALERIYSSKTGSIIQDNFINSCTTANSLLFPEFIKHHFACEHDVVNQIEGFFKNKKGDASKVLANVIFPLKEQACKDFCILFMNPDRETKELNDVHVDNLADIFSFDIIYYKEGKVIRSEKKERVFPSPLAISSDETGAYVMYTQSKARFFAEDESIKKSFTLDFVVEEAKKGALTKHKEETDSYTVAIDSLTNVFNDFIERVVDFVEAIKTNSISNDGQSFVKAQKALVNSKIFTGTLESNKKIKELCGDIIERIPDVRDKLKQEEIAKSLVNKPKEENKHKEVCNNCYKECDYYNGTRLKCDHVLDNNCLSE